MSVRIWLLLLLVCALGTASCEKEEMPVVLPPKGTAQPGSVNTGEDYVNQVYYDLEANRVVRISSNDSWDLSFDAAPEGGLVRMNGGRSINLLRTQSTDFGAVTALPAGTYESHWGFDDPAEQEKGNYMGNCRQQASPLVFIVRIPDFLYYKIQVLEVTDEAYRIRTGLLSDPVGTEYLLRKQAGYNRIYYSFATGPVEQPDPPQADWDLVFTRYRYIYYNLDNTGIDFPYRIAGVLLNPYRVHAAVDSSHTFENLTAETAQQAVFSNNADVIGGFGWKSYSIDQGLYTVYSRMNYLIRNRNQKLYKLHFLNYYQSGVKGNPSFESERLQ